MKVIGIMACDPNGVIGRAGKMPWSYKEEFEHFSSTTCGQIMVMGRKTFSSLPESILNNSFLNVVFSKEKRLNEDNDTRALSKFASAIFISSLDQFLSLQNLPVDKKLFMIGGSEIAKLFLENNLIDQFWLTKIHKVYQGDAMFPLELLEGWESKLIKKTDDFSIFLYTR